MSPSLRDDLSTLVAAFEHVPEVVKVLKISEEAGESAEAYIGLYGLNPRKGVTHSRDEVADELADVAITAIVALSEFSPDPLQHVTRRFAHAAERIRAREPEAVPTRKGTGS